MGLVQHNATIVRHGLIDQGLSQQHSVSHILDDGLLSSAVLEPDTVADLLAELDLHLLTDPFGHTHGCHSSRLSAAYLEASRAQSGL